MKVETEVLADGRMGIRAKQLAKIVEVAAWAEIDAVKALKIAQERIEDLDRQSNSSSYYSLGSIKNALKRLEEIEK